MAKKTSKSKKHAEAFHVPGKDGQEHVVGIGNLRVVIIKDDDCWFAQGLEIDFAAQGSSLKNVKKHFEDGLCATLHEHLRVYGNIEKVLTPAPPDVWKELLFDNAARLNLYTQVSKHELEQSDEQQLHAKFPFESIEYLEAGAAAGAAA